MLKLLLLDTKKYTGKKRGRAQKVAGHHRNTLSCSHGPVSTFNMLGEFDFSDEKLQDTTDVLPPKKADQNHPRKLGGTKSMIYTPFQ